MPTPKLQPRLMRRDIREYVDGIGGYIIARKIDLGTWLVTAHDAKLLVQTQGRVTNNEAGFRGRQWESDIDGQQYPSLKAALVEAMRLTHERAKFRAFATSQGL